MGGRDRRVPQIDFDRQIRRGRGLGDQFHIILAFRIGPHPIAIDIIAIAEVRMLFVDRLLLDHRAVGSHLEHGRALITLQVLNWAIDRYFVRPEIYGERIAAGSGFARAELQAVVGVNSLNGFNAFQDCGGLATRAIRIAELQLLTTLQVGGSLRFREASSTDFNFSKRIVEGSTPTGIDAWWVNGLTSPFCGASAPQWCLLHLLVEADGFIPDCQHQATGYHYRGAGEKCDLRCIHIPLLFS